MRRHLAILVLAMLAPPAALGAERPNVVYILADDLGYGDLGCYGQEVIQTPNIDKLCAGGMKFTYHYSGSTVCAPSRACLMTGQHTGHVWVRSNGNFRLREDDQDITIARVLKDAGYHTAMIGKAGTGCSVSPGQPNQKGFDYFYGFNGHGKAHFYFPPQVYRNDQVVKFPNNKKYTGDTYIHDEFMKEIMNYLDERVKENKSFFLHYAALIPHKNLVGPDKWVAQYRGKVKEVKRKGKRRRDIPAEPNATYAGMVSRLDWEVGEIMNKLQKLGIADDTLVVFASDNGPTSAGGYQPDQLASRGGLRGGKRDLFEGGVRVPMIAHWPDRIKAGSLSDHLCAFWDVMPTFCELAGATPPEDIDGISFLPTLLGVGEQQQHDYLYWEFYERGGKRAALTHKWKAVQLNMAEGGDPVMLFDIIADPAEKKDLASKHPEVVKQFATIFKEAHTPSPVIDWSRVKGKKQ